jgi:WXG100 family type VII secretion target
MTYFAANYAHMESAAQQIKAISGQIDSQLDSLRARLQQMTWTGEDRAAYQAHQAQWDAAVKDLNALLQEIGAGVGIARENYMTTEQGNAAVWGR